MRLYKLLANALVIAVLNLASIVIGFVVYWVSGVDAQLLVQVPVSFLLGTVAVIVWLVGFRRWNRLAPDEDYMRVFLLVFPVGAVVLTIVHFVVTGYLTGFGNIVGAFVIHGGENLLALPIAAALLKRTQQRLYR